MNAHSLNAFRLTVSIVTDYKPSVKQLSIAYIPSLAYDQLLWLHIMIIMEMFLVNISTSNAKY